jgi:bacteriocin-like protein
VSHALITFTAGICTFTVPSLNQDELLVKSLLSSGSHAATAGRLTKINWLFGLTSMLDNIQGQSSGRDVQELSDEELSQVSGGIFFVAAVIAIYRSANENAHKEDVNLSDMNIA